MWSLLLGSALAAELVVDAQIPTELAVNGLPVAQIFVPSRISVDRPAGPAQVTLFVDGKPQFFSVEIKNDKPTWFVVGKTGITVSQPDAIIGVGPAKVEFRVSGNGTVQLRLGDEQYRLMPGDTRTLELTPGEYPLTLRDSRGTAIWARGMLNVHPGGVMIVQLADGRLPEVVGSGGAFIAERQ